MQSFTDVVYNPNKGNDWEAFQRQEEETERFMVLFLNGRLEN